MTETDVRLFLEAVGLKALPREGWRRVGVAAPETVAAHSWGMALLALLHCPPELSRERVLALCVVHDLVEVRVGDITPHDGISKAEKNRREASAAAALFSDHPALHALWTEYEIGTSAEARFVHQLDKLDMGLQARVYADQADTTEFLASARPRLEPHLRALLES